MDVLFWMKWWVLLAKPLHQGKQIYHYFYLFIFLFSLELKQEQILFLDHIHILERRDKTTFCIDYNIIVDIGGVKENLTI